MQGEVDIGIAVAANVFQPQQLFPDNYIGAGGAGLADLAAHHGRDQLLLGGILHVHGTDILAVPHDADPVADLK